MLALLALGWPRSPQAAAAPVWQALNQGLAVHASVASLALDPQNPQRLYAGLGDGQGLWISDDGGSSGRSEPALAGRAVRALFTDPAAAGLVLAGTDAGLYRSADGGRSWQPEPGLPEITIDALAGDGYGGVFAGGESPVIYRAAPAAGGKSARRWQEMSALPGASAVLSLAVAGDGVVLAGSDGAGLFRSADGGQSWQAAAEIGPTWVAALATEGDGRRVLARTRRGLFASEDAGLTWRAAGGEINGRVDALAPDPATGDVYLGTGEGKIYRRAAGRGDWQLWSAGIDRPGLFQVLRTGPDAPPAAAAPATGSGAGSATAEASAARPPRWYAGSELGLYLSDDGGRTWQAAPGGPGRPEAQALTVAGDGSLWLGNRDGAYRLRPGEARWQPNGRGLPAGGVLALGTTGGDGRTLYAGLPGGLYRSDDGGGHWVATTWNQRGVPALLLDPHDPGRLWIRAQYERVYESRDRGQTWAARWTGLGLATQVITLAADPGRPATLYAGANQGFYRSLDGGLTWQNSGADLAGQTVFCLAAAGAEGSLHAGATDGAYRSPDGGQHWVRWGEGLAQISVTAIAFAPGDPERVYAGTKYRGVYFSSDGGAHWRAAGLDGSSVNALLFGPDGALLAATGSGVFRAGGSAR